MLPVILVHLWCIQNTLVLKKDTDIIHVAMGGGSKKFSHMLRGGSKSLGGLRRGGQKSLTTKIFNCPAPPTKVFMNTPLQGVTTTMDAKTTRLSVLHLGRNSKNPFVCFISNTTTLHIAGKHYFIKLRLESKQIGHQCLNGFSFIGLSFTRFS